MSKEEIIEELGEFLERNIALFDCQESCPDEIALNEDLRTPEYCNRCFATQLYEYLYAEGYLKVKRYEPKVLSKEQIFNLCFKTPYKAESIELSCYSKGLCEASQATIKALPGLYVKE